MATAKKNASRSLSSVIAEVSQKSDVPATDCGKAIRAYVRKRRRANETQLLKEWPALKDHTHGNRYPDMPADFADALIASRVATLSARKPQA